MTSKAVDWPVLDYTKQSVAVPGTKKPGQTGRLSRLLQAASQRADVIQIQLTIAMVQSNRHTMKRVFFPDIMLVHQVLLDSSLPRHLMLSRH